MNWQTIVWFITVPDRTKKFCLGFSQKKEIVESLVTSVFCNAEVAINYYGLQEKESTTDTFTTELPLLVVVCPLDKSRGHNYSGLQ